MNDLGKLIENCGWMQDNVAVQLCINPEQFSQHINNRTPVRISLIYQIADILSVHVAVVAAAVIPELKEFVYGEKAIGAGCAEASTRAAA